MKTIEVVAAVIQHQNNVLAVQRGPAKFAYISEKWEFPGGKMEAGETEQGEPKLTEHLAFRWLSMDDLEEMDWADADVPIVEMIKLFPNFR
jgi:8-oxo-dGTP diphosphatase